MEDNISKKAGDEGFCRDLDAMFRLRLTAAEIVAALQYSSDIVRQIQEAFGCDTWDRGPKLFENPPRFLGHMKILPTLVEWLANRCEGELPQSFMSLGRVWHILLGLSPELLEQIGDTTYRNTFIPQWAADQAQAWEADQLRGDARAELGVLTEWVYAKSPELRALNQAKVERNEANCHEVLDRLAKAKLGTPDLLAVFGTRERPKGSRLHEVLERGEARCLPDFGTVNGRGLLDHLVTWFHQGATKKTMPGGLRECLVRILVEHPEAEDFRWIVTWIEKHDPSQAAWFKENTSALQFYGVLYSIRAFPSEILGVFGIGGITPSGPDARSLEGLMYVPMDLHSHNAEPLAEELAKWLSGRLSEPLPEPARQQLMALRSDPKVSSFITWAAQHDHRLRDASQQVPADTKKEAAMVTC